MSMRLLPGEVAEIPRRQKRVRYPTLYFILVAGGLVIWGAVAGVIKLLGMF
ncbi:MAG: hypothetical protein ACXU82_03655 [Caulobacteraceae bacterium]